MNSVPLRIDSQRWSWKAMPAIESEGIRMYHFRRKAVVMKNYLFKLMGVCMVGLSCMASCKDGAGLGNDRIEGALAVNGLARNYILYLPQGYEDDVSRQFSLVIGLHGTGGSAQQFDKDYKLTRKANEAQFIVVYPNGVASDGVAGIRTWNAGRCCDYAEEHDIDDVDFIRMLIDELVGTYRINPRRVYVTGMSNGAMLTYRLACELSDKIAAVAPVSGTMMVTEPCILQRPVPVLHIHSIQDKKVPYVGGEGLANYYFTPVDSTLAVMSNQNNCQEEAEIIVNDSRYRLTQWTACEQAVKIVCYLTQDGGHAWPGGNKSWKGADKPSTVINADDLIWDFFQQYELPEH